MYVGLREDAVNSLVYEAEAWLRNPVYGCDCIISDLLAKLKQAETDLHNATKKLALYIGPKAMMPVSKSQPVHCKGESAAAWWRVFQDGFRDTRSTHGTSTSSSAAGGSATGCDEGRERSAFGAVNTDHTAAASCTSTSPATKIWKL
ncbi:hypothetical protein Dsin_009763 [Dipteronia sinensis]|uniref:LOB domain-containing protein n=1 Tax=Dipteronia sinensis TaxID=43782 RepID=A0AAE0ARL2_9ROSI|nr:hypothetical protein Dsin_009763 [Dipteronia sinensis]